MIAVVASWIRGCDGEGCLRGEVRVAQEMEKSRCAGREALDSVRVALAAYGASGMPRNGMEPEPLCSPSPSRNLY
jgi:hypothetical protein